MSRRSRKFWFLTASITAHVALGVGVFASGIWHIDRLDRDRRSLSTVAMMLPPPPAPSGGMSLPKPEVQVKERVKPVVAVVVQPPTVKPPPSDAKPTDPTTGTGEGSDKGPGTGPGKPTDTGTCMVEPCGDTKTPEPPPKKLPPVDETIVVGPNDLTMMRLTGDPQVHPSDNVKSQMLRDGRTRSVGIVKVCVSEIGQVSSINVLSSTKYPAYDQRLVDAIRSWTYKPYAAKGRNVKVCGTVTFVYSIKG